MEMHILPASEVRNQLSSVIKDIKKEGVPYFVTQHGKAVMVLMDMERYNELMSRLEDLADEQDERLAKRVKEARRNFRRAGGIPLAE